MGWRTYCFWGRVGWHSRRLSRSHKRKLRKQYEALHPPAITEVELAAELRRVFQECTNQGPYPDLITVDVQDFDRL